MKSWLKANVFQILDVLKAFGILVLLLMVIRFGVVIAQDVQLAKQNTAATQQLVKGETIILKAIQQLEEDNQVTSEQKTNIIICMLKVPVTLRTTDLEANCRRQFAATASPGSTTSPSPATTNRQSPGQPTAPASPPTTPTSPSSPSPSPSPNLLLRILQSL